MSAHGLVRLEPGPAFMAVLFTDAVGSTEQRVRLGDRAADRVRRIQDALVSEAVAHHRGTVVKLLGDGLLAVFGSASEAIAAAVEAQRAVEQHSRDVPPDEAITLRMGISAGEINVEDDDVFGTPVVEASRLCDAAGPRQVLTSDILRSLAGTRTTATFESLGTRDLKGLAEPVPVHAVVWAATSGADLPGPLRQSPELLGRDEERRTVRAALAGDGATAPRLVLVSGAAGMGKTALVADLARAAVAAGTTVLYGRCSEVVSLPYRPWVEALRREIDRIDRVDRVDRVEPAEHDDVRERLGPAADVLLPFVADAVAAVGPRSDDPVAEQHLLFQGFARWLEHLAAGGDVVLVIDDLHWADPSTVGLLAHVLDAPMRHRPLIVGTVRDDEVDRQHPLHALLGALKAHGDAVVRVDLAGLDLPAIAELVAAVAGGGDVEPSLAELLRAETGGNPLFVREVVRDLLDTGSLRNVQGRWSLPTGTDLRIPDSIRDTVVRRLEGLGDDAVAVLAAAAVLGTEFELALLRAVAGVDDDLLLSALDAAVRAQLVSELRGRRRLGYRFDHALVHLAASELLTETRRVQLHARALEARRRLAGDDPDVAPELARHALAAVAVVGTDLTVDLLRAAADHALARVAPEQAVGWLERARALVAAETVIDVVPLIDLDIALGRAQRVAGLRAARGTLLAAARSARDAGATDRLVAAALANSRGNFSELYRADIDKIAVLRDALDAHAARDQQRARLLATLAAELVFARRDDERLWLADEALGIARDAGDPETLVEVLALHVNACHTMDRLDERLAHTAELRALAEEHGTPTQRFNAHRSRYLVVVETGDLDEADHCLAGLRSLAGEYPRRRLDFVLEQSASWRAMLEGRIADAQRHAFTSFDLAQRIAEPDAASFFGGQLVGVRRLQGRLAEIADQLGSGWMDPYGATYPYLARVQLEAGNVTAALAAWERALDEPADAYARVGQVAGTHYLSRAWTAARLNDRAEAERMYATVLPHAELLLNPLEPHPVGHHFLGMLAASLDDLELAVSHLDAAIGVHVRLGAVIHAARSRAELADVLQRRRGTGDRARAAELLTAVRTTASRTGAVELDREVARVEAVA